MFVRLAPEAAILPVLVRGVVWPMAAHNWLTQLRRCSMDREKTAAALQLLAHLVLNPAQGFIANWNNQPAPGATGDGGPRFFGARSRPCMIATFERRIDREIPVVSLVPGQPLPGLPVIVSGLMAALDTYDSVIEMAATAQAFGVRQTSVDQFLLGMLNQASSASGS
jgi:hypothetical protein